MKGVVVGVLAVVFVGVALAWTSGNSSPSSRTQGAVQPPGGLTAGGRLLWNFEALLRETFGNRSVSVSGRANFSCVGRCVPLARFAPYRYTFANPRSSSLRLSAKNMRNANFGNYPVPVLIRGRTIACDARERRFLVRYLSTSSFTLGCLAPLN